MEFKEVINGHLEEIKGEIEILSAAQNPEEEKEALKDILDAFMRGAKNVQERIDNYNDRRWQR